jgi:hypothetical protein
VSEVRSGCIDGDRSRFGMSTGRTCHRRWFLGQEPDPSSPPPPPTTGYLACRLFFCFWRSCNVHIPFPTYANVQRCLENLCPYIPAPPATVSWGSWNRVRHATYPRRGMPFVDHHDRILSEEGHRVALIRDLIDFHALGEGSRDHEVLHHVAIPELMLDG